MRIVEAIARWARGQYPLLPSERCFQAPAGEAAFQQAKRMRAIPRLGELLVEKRFITGQQLEDALLRQRETNPAQLGTILKGMGVLQESDLEAVLAMYHKEPARLRMQN